jgi:hypothetical protein
MTLTPIAQDKMVNPLVIIDSNSIACKIFKLLFNEVLSKLK